MNTEPLREIGLTDSEIKVYLALLKLGQVSAGSIVDEAKVTRSKIYDILERLKNKGLVSFITKESTKYFSASNPDNLIEYLSEKERKIKQDKQEINKLLPELSSYLKETQKSKIAEIFFGIKGMENAFNEIINEFEKDSEWYAFGAGKGEKIEQIQIFFSKLHQKRIRQRIKSKIIFNESSKGLFPEQEKSKYVQVKYIDNTTPAAINIYKDFTIIAILNQEPIIILIKNKETADSFREYFNIMWKVAKK